ncbi:helix-turn-helix domain-containing protein [Streptomyces sp. NTH33]|uniref:helix-turn-helix domain-containing protein n=1 Tax=Streptomyces sp. NTH33 TaxID=1735453 RepID=UPI0021ABE2B8|nr:helix-turn-helix domain-containing protein [Streptomyces sp. NTH33]
MTVSEISRRTGLHVATASRLVAELVSYGFLTRDTDRRVRIGMRLWELATRASPSCAFAARTREPVGPASPEEMVLSSRRKHYPGIGLPTDEE